VVDSWLRCLNPETAATYSSLMTAVVKGSRSTTPRKLVLRQSGLRPLTQHLPDDPGGSCTYALGMLAHYAFGIVPIHAIQKYGKDWTKPQNWVSNGPFVLAEWSPRTKSS